MPNPTHSFAFIAFRRVQTRTGAPKLLYRAMQGPCKGILPGAKSGFGASAAAQRGEGSV